MPVFTEQQAGTNPILKLAVELRQRTYGLCDIRIGPWGFGVTTNCLTKVGAVVCTDPDPCGEEPPPPGIKEYTARIKPIWHTDGAAPHNWDINMDTLRQLCGDADIMTRIVANALLELSSRSVIVSDQEYSDAYDRIFEAEQQEEDRFTAGEAKKLNDLRWYETKTPEEIVSFQVCEKRLCMPIELFQDMAETVFNHPVAVHEWGSSRQELLEELRELSADPPTQAIGPVMM